MPMVSLPQFTEIESKIAGPLTFKQFITLIGIGGICVVVYFSLPRPLSIMLSVGILVGGAALILIKIDEIPLYTILLRRVFFLFSPRAYFWGKGGLKTPTIKEVEIKKAERDKVKIKREGYLKKLIFEIETKK